MNHPKSSLWSTIGWIVVYILLMLSIVTPLNFITINLIMIPVLILFMKLDWRWFVPAYAAALATLYFATGGLGLMLILISLFFLPPVIAMGLCYKKKSSSKLAILAGTLSMMGILILFLIIGRIAGYDPMVDFKDILQANIDRFPAQLQEQFNAGAIDNLLFLVSQMIPFFIVVFSLYYVIITHWLARRLVNRRKELIPGLPPVRTWMLPKSLVWYFVICMILDFFVRTEAGSFLSMILLNLFPLLTLAFVVQAVSFLSFYVHVRKKSRVWPVLLVALVIFIPATQYIISLVGLFDVMFPLRERISNNHKE